MIEMCPSRFLLQVVLISSAFMTHLGSIRHERTELICIRGYFQCGNHTVCMPQQNICDGHVDCPDGSDETDCIDKNVDQYWDNFFRKRLSAINDDSANACHFSEYNGSCVCRSSDILCGHRGLQQIPAEDLLLDASFVNLLDFEGNDFRVVNSELLEALPEHVEILNLAHCNIAEIEVKAFHKIDNVTELHLDNNKLKIIPADIFPQVNNFETLSLQHNQISQIDFQAFHQLSGLKKLFLTGNKLTEIKREIFEPLQNLTALHLQNNQIKFINEKSFPQLLSLDLLSLVENRIESLDGDDGGGGKPFAKLPHLQHLYLSNNRLVRLKNDTFFNLKSLQDLTLNDNFIKIIEVGVFHNCPKLESLSLQRNQFRTLAQDVFNPLTKLNHIYFDRFELCESALHVRDCEPKGDGISSHEHLLDNPILRASVWIMGAIGCTGNLIVLLGRILAPSNNVVHSLYLRNLALSDLLMGVYLFAIAIADYSYRGVYLRYQYAWRHSFMCNLCGFLSTLSCESSVLILTLVTWDRFVSVTQPLARKQPSPRTATLTLLFLWTLAAGVALAPFSKGYFGEEFYGSNGVCLPLHIHEPYAMGWEYSAGMFMLVNALALAFICYAYTRMIQEIRASGVACRSTRQSQERDKVAQRFGIIVLTDSLCWVPVIIVKLVALAGHPIPVNLYAWLAIFILPINSALNPVLYTLTTTVFKKQMRKVVNGCVRKKSRKHQQDQHHSASESGFSLSFGVFPIGGGTRRILSYRGTQSSLTTSKNSWKRPPTAV